MTQFRGGQLEAIETALRGTNEAEGIGLKVTVLGRVDMTNAKSYVMLLATSVVPAALAAWAKVHRGAGALSQCELTAEQETLLQGMAAQFNATCVFNVTLGPAAP